MSHAISYHKKELKGFLLVEFRKGALLVRLRFKVLLTFNGGYGIEIRKSGSKLSEGSQVRGNRVSIGDRVSEGRLFKAMVKYISDKEKIVVASVAFRWEDGSLEMPK